MDTQKYGDIKNTLFNHRSFLSKVKVTIYIGENAKDYIYNIDAKDISCSQLLDYLDQLISIFSYQRILDIKPVYTKEIEYILSLINNSKVEEFESTCLGVIFERGLK